MKAKYRITMEVEVEIDNLNDKKTNLQNRADLARYAAMGLKRYLDGAINKVDVERIGVTGIVPRVVHSSKRGSVICPKCKAQWVPTGDDKFLLDNGHSIRCKCGCEDVRYRIDATKWIDPSVVHKPFFNRACRRKL